MDILEKLSSIGGQQIIEKIFSELSPTDLKCCSLVSKLWLSLVDELWEHYELNSLGNFSEPRISLRVFLFPNSLTTLGFLGMLHKGKHHKSWGPFHYPWMERQSLLLNF